MLKLIPKFLKKHKFLRALIKLFPSEKYQSFKYNNHIIFSNLQDAEARQVFITNKFEDYGYFLLAEHFLPHNGIHFDVGANYGFQTFGLFNKFSNNQIKYFLIEPNLDCHYCHNQTAAINPQFDITSCRIGLSSYIGDAHFQYCKENSGGGSVFNSLRSAKTDFNTINQDSYTIKCTTLDSFLEKNKIDHVDLIKIDVEGSEFDLLTGAKDALAHGRIKAVYIEINSKALDDHNRNPSEIFEILEKYDFQLFYPHSNIKGYIEKIKLNSKTLSLSKLDKQDIINQSKTSHALLDILAIHPSIIKN